MNLEIWMGLVAVLGFAVVSGGWLPVVLLLALAIGLHGHIRVRYSATARVQRRRFILISLPVLAIVFFQLMSSRFTFQTPQFVAVSGTVYILACAVLEMYRNPREVRPENYHLGLITAIFVAGITVENWTYPYFLLAYFVLAVGLLRQPYGGWWGRPAVPQAAAPKWGIVLACLLSLAMAFPARYVLPTIGRALTQMYSQSLLNTTLGGGQLFGNFADLNGTLRSGRSRILVARVSGPPTLLRTQAYNTYHGCRWLTPAVTRQNRVELKPVNGVIQLPGPAPDRLRHWSVAPVIDISGPLPVAADTYQLSGLLSVNLDVLDSLSADAFEPYEVWGHEVGRERSPHRPPSSDPAYLEVPEELVADLRAWAGNQSLAQLSNTLLQQGVYDPNARRPAGMDPVQGFLKTGLHGHCELFASTLALSLRLKGIPTRYVVGFQMNEYNPLTRQYLVRERDAHAWVEVYQDGRWVTFDPTPAAQTEAAHPDGYQLEFGDQLVDGARAAGAAFLAWLRRAHLPAWPLLAGLAATLAWLGWRFRGQLSGWLRPAPKHDSLAELLERFEKKARLPREPQETVLEYAERFCEPHAQWLRDYARARFAGDNLLADLSARLDQFQIPFSPRP